MINVTVYVAALRSFLSRAKVSGVVLKAAEAKFPQNLGVSMSVTGIRSRWLT
jgi:hypothetical protein